MEHIGNTSFFDATQIAGDSRGLMANAAGGNFSVTFVPLISLVATIVPRIVSRIRNVRPSQTVSARGFRNAKFYSKKSLDIQFCNSMESFEANIFPGFDDIFYICKPYEEKRINCKYNKEYHLKDDLKDFEKQAIGKIIGMNDCFYLKLYKCNKGFYFDPEKKSCVEKKQQQQILAQRLPS